MNALSQAVLNKFTAKFPQITDHAKVQLEQQLSEFMKLPVVARYLSNPDGSAGHLEGTPKGELAPNIEFQKTIGSFVALKALMSGAQIFEGRPNDPKSLEHKMRSALDSVNTHFQNESGGKLSDFEPLTDGTGNA